MYTCAYVWVSLFVLHTCNYFRSRLFFHNQCSRLPVPSIGGYEICHEHASTLNTRPGHSCGPSVCSGVVATRAKEKAGEKTPGLVCPLVWAICSCLCFL